MYYKGTKTLISKTSFLRLFILFFIFYEITKWLFNFLSFLQADRSHRFLSEAFSSFTGLSFSWIFLCVHLPRMAWTAVDVWEFFCGYFVPIVFGAKWPLCLLHDHVKQGRGKCRILDLIQFKAQGPFSWGLNYLLLWRSNLWTIILNLCILHGKQVRGQAHQYMGRAFEYLVYIF